MRGLLLGAAVATTVGAIDDFRGLRGGRSSAARRSRRRSPSASASGSHRFTFPLLGVHELPTWVGMPLTVLWIVAIMNMVNFLDGLDGLAAGVCAISAFTFSRDRALARPTRTPAILAAIVFGACLGFLRHNFYPARIFMGDSGALLLGFMLAAVSVQGLLKTAALATLVLPLLVLAIPVLDTSFVVAKRLSTASRSTSRTPAPAPPLHEHRLLAAPRGPLPVRLVRDARPRGARDALRASAPSRPLGPDERRIDAPIGARSRSPLRSTSSTCSRSSSSETR